MSSYEANWESGVLVTAEAVRGIGFPPEDPEEAAPREMKTEAASQSDAAD